MMINIISSRLHGCMYSTVNMKVHSTTTFTKYVDLFVWMKCKHHYYEADLLKLYIFETGILVI